MDKQPDFETFCQELEGLKGQVPLIRPRNGLTERIMGRVVREKRRHLTETVREWAPGIALALAIGLTWFFFQNPLLSLSPSAL